MDDSKINTVSAIVLTLSIVVSYINSSLPRTFINETKSATLLNIVYITAVVLFIIILFCKLFEKFPGLDILDIANFLGGNFLKQIVGWLFIAYFISTSAIILRNFCQGLVVVYYPLTKYIFIILMFVIATSLISKLSFRVAVNTASIIFPIIFLSIILLFIGNLGNFSFRRIYPILGDGLHTTFILGLKNIGAFGGICYLYFLPPMLKEPEKLKKIAIGSVLLTGLFIFLCVATLLFMFSYFLNTDEIIPLFSAARHIEFGIFFQRFESIFLLVWIISFCCYLTITCKFATHIFKKMFHLSDISLISMIFVLLLFGVSLIPTNYAISNFLETNVYRYLRIAVGFILGLTVLFFATIKKIKIEKRKVN